MDAAILIRRSLRRSARCSSQPRPKPIARPTARSASRRRSLRPHRVHPARRPVATGGQPACRNPPIRGLRARQTPCGRDGLQRRPAGLRDDVPAPAAHDRAWHRAGRNSRHPGDPAGQKPRQQGIRALVGRRRHRRQRRRGRHAAPAGPPANGRRAVPALHRDHLRRVGHGLRGSRAKDRPASRPDDRPHDAHRRRAAGLVAAVRPTAIGPGAMDPRYATRAQSLVSSIIARSPSRTMRLSSSIES
jgi:hypothetical protein